ncbi:MAG TPA: sulfite exporter TauE/SafE family protein [Chitinophagaceae bacterium]|nr:sulfite exporter TauE/SafE family protein [Chitinophagaceae bacterium]
MKELETCLASLGIGLSLGLIGAGGSILTIPVFVYILKKDPVSSSVYSMFVVGISSMAGSIQSIFNKLVDFKAVLTFGIPSVIGVFIARKTIFPVIPDELFSIGSFILSKNMFLMLCLSALMFLAARRMLKPAIKKDQVGKEDKQVKISLLLRGLLVGMVTGLLGIGGGFLIVPALYLLVNLPVKKAIGTALLIITINSLFSFLNSYASMEIEWLLLIKFSMGAVLGIIIGTKLSRKIPGNYLKKTFGWVILSMSFYIVCKEFFF